MTELRQMELQQIIREIPGVRLYGDPQARVCAAVSDSRACTAGALFLCVKGYVQDGNRYAPAAVRAGATALLTSDLTSLGACVQAEGGALGEDGLTLDGIAAPVPVAVVPDMREAVAVAAAVLAGDPCRELDLIGITGTKGKTTVSYMLRSIFTAAGIPSGLVGTICNYVGDERIETERTTPEATVLQPLLRRMADAGIRKCVMEVSSQGLHLKRVGRCHFTTAVFTNLSRDHIGENEHADMEEYAAAKASLFALSGRALINADNAWSQYMLDAAQSVRNGQEPIPVYTYGIEHAEHAGPEPYFCAHDVQTFPESIAYDLYENGRFTAKIRVPIPGRFSVYNSLAALGAARLEGFDLRAVQAGLAGVHVPGKAEIVPTGRDFTVMIDYAHNPDSFINILTTVKEFAKRTVFVFGCGGDRNRPRALMGETAGKYADFTIITSDNPRSEDPASIVRDLEAGIKPTGADYICIVDRREAIRYAIRNARPGDVIILAGKGHETYQIFKDRTVHFDEREVVAEILREETK